MDLQCTPEVSHQQLINGRPMWDVTAKGTCTASTPHTTKKSRGVKRKLGLVSPDQIEQRRKAANISERRRQNEINKAMDDLRHCLPVSLTDNSVYPKKLSKIVTLKLAAGYIAALGDMLKDSEEVSDLERRALVGNVPPHPRTELASPVGYPVNYPTPPAAFPPAVDYPVNPAVSQYGYTPMLYGNPPVFVPLMPPNQQYFNYTPYPATQSYHRSPSHVAPYSSADVQAEAELSQSSKRRRLSDSDEEINVVDVIPIKQEPSDF